MAMAAVTFSKINDGFGFGFIKKNNEKCLLMNGLNVNRNHSLRPIPCSIQTPRSYHWTPRCHKACTIMLSPELENADCGISLKFRAEHVGAPVEEETEKGEELSRETLIWRAIKLPMYTVGLIPVTVGTAAAYWQTGLYSSGRYFTILASYLIVIAWLNLSNDVYDFDTGADKNKKESVVNLFGSRTGINIIAWSLLAVGFLGLTWVAVQARNPRALVLLAHAVFCFILYQCPPFRLSYYGVGEPLLFIAFSPLSTIAFYLLHSTTSELPITSTVIWSSILVGFTTSLILFCSHFHQIKDDKAAGKISPMVRLGTEGGFQVVKMAVIGLYSLLLILGATQTLPLASIVLCAMTLPMGNLVISFVQENHSDKTKIFMSKYLCVRLHTLFGGALATGLVAARMFAGRQLKFAVTL